MFNRNKLTLQNLGVDTFETTVDPSVVAVYTTSPGTYNDTTAGCCGPMPEDPPITSSISCNSVMDCT